MRKPNFRRIGQVFRAAGKQIAAVASAVRASVRNSREAQRAANEHLILTREEAKRRGLWPEHRRADNRKIMREVRKGGLSAVVQEMEKRRIDYHSRDYQPKEVKLICDDL